MSAFVISDEEFNVLYSFAHDMDEDRTGLYLYTEAGHTQDFDRVLPRDVDHIQGFDKGFRYPVDELIHRLIDENYYSVNCRYKEQTAVVYPHLTGVQYTIPMVAKVIRTLEYNSCEAPDYYQSLAYQLLTLLKDKLIGIVAQG